MAKPDRPIRQVRVIADASEASGRDLLRGTAQYIQAFTDWRLLTVFQPYSLDALDLSEDDGLILGGMGPLTDSVIRRLDLRRQKVVGCSAMYGRWGIPYVGLDNYAIGRVAAEHFMQNGHTRCVFDSFQDNGPDATERWAGFRSTLEEAGIKAAMVSDDWLEATSPRRHRDFRELTNLLTTMPKPIGLFMSFDAIAFTAIEEILSTGIHVPEEVAVVSVDNDGPRCEMASPKLSSIETQMSRLGYNAAQMLDMAFRGEELAAEPLIMPTVGVVVRQSSDLVAIEDLKLASALRYIREHACDPCSVDNVLDHVECSRRWLETHCHRLLRCSPHEQIVRVRMDRAKWLLKTTELPLDIVAERCGYSLPQNFRRAFQLHENAVPSAYRKQMRGHSFGWHP